MLPVVSIGACYSLPRAHSLTLVRKSFRLLSGLSSAPLFTCARKSLRMVPLLYPLSLLMSFLPFFFLLTFLYLIFCVPHYVPGALRVQKRMLAPLVQELQMVVSCVGAGSQILVLCKSHEPW